MKNVLLVDDEEHELMFMKFLLTDHYKDEVELSYASTIDEAKDTLSAKPFDVILLDDKLGEGLTSVDTIPILQQKAFNVPIVVLSKDISCSHLRERARSGLNKVVEKFDFRNQLSGGLLDTLKPTLIPSL